MCLGLLPSRLYQSSDVVKVVNHMLLLLLVLFIRSVDTESRNALHLYVQDIMTQRWKNFRIAYNRGLHALVKIHYLIVIARLLCIFRRGTRFLAFAAVGLLQLA